MQLSTMPQFDKSAANFLSAQEILVLEEILLRDPQCGKPLTGTSGHLRSFRHPEGMITSEKGYRPVVIYFIHTTKNEIVLVDVVDNVEQLKVALRDPWTWIKAANVGRLLKALWDGVQ